METKRFTCEYAGKELILETGKLAPQANAAVTARIGDTMVLATVVMSEGAREGIDFFPLQIEYEERYYAVGAIKGNRYQKREGRPPTEAILTSRMTDRGFRPLFPSKMRNEVQVIITPLSVDGENKPDIVGMVAAGAALEISSVPFEGPVTGVRVGRVEGQFVVNPTPEQIEESELQLVVIGDGERICMVDCDAKDVADDIIVEAFDVAMKAMGPVTEFYTKIREEIGKPKATDDQIIWAAPMAEEDAQLVEDLKQAMIPQLDQYLFNTPKGSKGERKAIMNGLKEKTIEEFKPKLVEKGMTEEEAVKHLTGLYKKFFYEFMEEQVTLAILDRDQRVDGRTLDQIRPLEAEVGLLPRTHGSGLFYRGETHILSTVTLGAPGDKMYFETMESEGEKHYFHHYNFPPYSVGEAKPLRGAGRRELGHGALAEKALLPVLPDDEDFPYTVRVVSEVMSSNGSSSMGSTCGSTLALMDAGVPLKKPVAGMAMGMASHGDRWKVLTDLQDLEDGNGGMDWKVTGTRDGVTAIQMDTKTRGLTMEMIQAAMPQTRKALNEVIDLIEATIPAPREELSMFAPRIIGFFIDPEKIGEIIGPGGKIIRKMTEETNSQIDVREDGFVTITSNDPAGAAEAEKQIKGIVREIQVGDVFEEAEVMKILKFGAFVRLTPGTDGMLHISEISWERTENIDDVVKLGDKLKVKVINVFKGKVDVSMKVLTPKPEGYVEPPKRDDRRRDDRRGGRRDDRRGGRRDDRRGGRRDDRRDDRRRDDGPKKKKVDGYPSEDDGGPIEISESGEPRY